MVRLQKFKILQFCDHFLYIIFLVKIQVVIAEIKISNCHHSLSPYIKYCQYELMKEWNTQVDNK